MIGLYLRNHCASKLSTYYVNLDLNGKWVEDKRFHLKVTRALLFHRYHLHAYLWGLWRVPKEESQRYKVTIEKFRKYMEKNNLMVMDSVGEQSHGIGCN